MPQTQPSPPAGEHEGTQTQHHGSVPARGAAGRRVLARTAEPEWSQSPGMFFALGRYLNTCSAAPRGLQAAPGKGQSWRHHPCSAREAQLGFQQAWGQTMADLLPRHFLRPSNKCGFVCFVFKEPGSSLWWGAQQSGSRRVMIPHQVELGCAGHWRPSPGCTEIPHSVTKTAVYSSCRGAAAHRTRVHRPALSLHAGRVCPALSLAAGKPRAAQILPSRGCREDGGVPGCRCLLAPTLQAVPAPGEAVPVVSVVWLGRAAAGPSGCQPAWGGHAGHSPARAPHQEPVGTETVLSHLPTTPAPSQLQQQPLTIPPVLPPPPSAPASSCHPEAWPVPGSLWLCRGAAVGQKLLLVRVPGCCVPPGSPLQAGAGSRSTYHDGGQAGERVGAAQGGDADSLQHTAVREGRGEGRRTGERGAGPGSTVQERGARTMAGLEVRLRNLVTSVST